MDVVWIRPSLLEELWLTGAPMGGQDTEVPKGGINAGFWFALPQLSGFFSFLAFAFSEHQNRLLSTGEGMEILAEQLFLDDAARRSGVERIVLSPLLFAQPSHGPVHKRVRVADVRPGKTWGPMLVHWCNMPSTAAKAELLAASYTALEGGATKEGFLDAIAARLRGHGIPLYVGKEGNVTWPKAEAGSDYDYDRGR